MSRTWSTTLLTVVLAAAVSGCGGGDDAAAFPEPSTVYTAGDVPVLTPGRPGESAAVVQPGESGEMANPGVYTQEDLDFVAGMVPHHAQALEMAELADERARDTQVQNLADRIIAGQRPEIDAMQTWLAAQGLPPVSEDSSHDSMVGMASQDQLLQLVAADGDDFDALFLQLMTAHHEGAIEMAEAAVGAKHPLVSEMVEDTIVSQSVEISRMQQMLDELT